jgi:hypothetical protein
MQAGVHDLRAGALPLRATYHLALEQRLKHRK